MALIANQVDSCCIPHLLMAIALCESNVDTEALAYPRDTFLAWRHIELQQCCFGFNLTSFGTDR